MRFFISLCSLLTSWMEARIFAVFASISAMRCSNKFGLKFVYLVAVIITTNGIIESTDFAKKSEYNGNHMITKHFNGLCLLYNTIPS